MQRWLVSADASQWCRMKILRALGRGGFFMSGTLGFELER